jgi:hypothetical protein
MREVVVVAGEARLAAGERAGRVPDGQELRGVHRPLFGQDVSGAEIDHPTPLEVKEHEEPGEQHPGSGGGGGGVQVVEGVSGLFPRLPLTTLVVSGIVAGGFVEHAPIGVDRMWWRRNVPQRMRS